MSERIHSIKNSTYKNIMETGGYGRFLLEIIKWMPSAIFYLTLFKRLFRRLSIHRSPKCECKYTSADWETYTECGILPLDNFWLDLSDVKNRDDLKKKIMEKTRESKRICDKCKKELIQNIISS